RVVHHLCGVRSGRVALAPPTRAAREPARGRGMSARAERYLAEIGITVYKRRGFVAEPANAPSAAAEPVPVARISEPQPAEPTSEAWDRPAAEVRACTLCALHKTRTQTVFGVGRRDAELLVIGEAPGADEDRQGEPFVGRAGQLLNAMLRAIGLP